MPTPRTVRPPLATRLEAWWRRRQRIRRWQRTPPEQQMAIWLQAIDETPALREQFQRALRLRGYDRLVRGPK